MSRYASALSCYYAIRSSSASSAPFFLVVSLGSITDFSYCPPERAAIVNAANENCLGGSGVDGAISKAGGPALHSDRINLPVVASYGNAVRCRTGEAVMTGPATYGSLGVSYVVHAVGPNYTKCADALWRGDESLAGAYNASMERAKEAKLEAVAFSLLSSGVFRGRRSLREILKIGVETICSFVGYAELKEVHLCAFDLDAKETLEDICNELGLLRASLPKKPPTKPTSYFRTTVPPGGKPGQKIRVQCPGGSVVLVTVPRDLGEGDAFLFEMRRENA